MILESVHAATQSIFTFFMPVLVLASGVPVQALALYYPAYGVVAVTGRLFAPRLADRLGRDTTLIIGIALGLVALILGVLAPHFVVLAVAGCLAAGAGAILGPTLLALTIDRAPPSRIGAAVATYSMGYQIGAGFGGAVWGVMFATLGTASPFLAAAAVHVAVIGILWLRR
jgi:predicted MFS family arabinose efflux permease